MLGLDQQQIEEDYPKSHGLDSSATFSPLQLPLILRGQLPEEEKKFSKSLMAVEQRECEESEFLFFYFES